MNGERKSAPRTVEIMATALPLHCPVRDGDVWSSHPRVYLPVGKDGEATCPYCGTRYVVKGDMAAGH